MWLLEYVNVGGESCKSNELIRAEESADTPRKDSKCELGR
jgi:hypothetical protein